MKPQAAFGGLNMNPGNNNVPVKIEESIIRYFECLYGEDFTLSNVLTFNSLESYLKHHNITRDFLIKVIKEHKNRNNE